MLSVYLLISYSFTARHNSGSGKRKVDSIMLSRQQPDHRPSIEEMAALRLRWMPTGRKFVISRDLLMQRIPRLSRRRMS